VPIGKKASPGKSFDGERLREAIYRVVASIPEGQLASYGQIAELAGLPKQARQVGRTLSQLPRDTRLPWFRVVNATGEISFSANSQGYQRQLKHLLNEGSAEADGRLRWRECRWQP
jgi:methylated-DNA-protein-cysteine methyltransferase-like protein